MTTFFSFAGVLLDFFRFSIWHFAQDCNRLALVELEPRPSDHEACTLSSQNASLYYIIIQCQLGKLQRNLNFKSNVGFLTINLIIT